MSITRILYNAIYSREDKFTVYQVGKEQHQLYKEHGLKFVLDSFCQGANGEGLWRDEDYYIFGMFRSFELDGCIGAVVLDIGETPHSDSETELNNAALQGVNGISSAEFCGGWGDNDGGITLSDDVDVSVTMMTTRNEPELCWSEPPWYRHIELEVGSTDSGTTMNHIYMGAGVARWPYHSTKMVVWTPTYKLQAIKDDLFREYFNG